MAAGTGEHALDSAAARYWGFISYSHADIGWAQWLHRALEGFVVPRRLVGRETAAGRLPDRLFPVFRDRDELSSSAELGGVIEQALRQSRCLIVICSPKAARSRWVNEEIRSFKRRGRQARVLALIVDGEPGDPARECFPPALCHVVDEDGRLLDEPVEPIAADARPGRDSRREALLRVLAGMLDVPYDELRQRARQQLAWQRLRQTAAAALLLAAGVGAWQAERARSAEADRQAQLRRWVDAGQRALQEQRPASAAVFLVEALRHGEVSTALPLLLGQAMQSLDLQSDVRIRHDGSYDGNLAWLPDSRRFLTIWGDIRLWDAATGTLLRRYASSELSAGLSAVASPDGRQFAASGSTAFSDQPPVVELFDVASGTRLLRIAGETSGGRYGPSHRSYSADSRWLAVIGHDGAVSLHAADTGQLVWRPPVVAATSAVFDRDRGDLLIAGRDGTLSIWDPATRTRRLRIGSGLRDRVHAFFAGSGRLIVMDGRGKIRVHDRASGRLIDAFGGHIGAIAASALSDDGRRLMTVAADGTKVWDTASGDQLLHVTCDCPPAENHLDPSGRWLAARFDRLRVGIWSLDSGRQVATLEGHSNNVNTAHFSPDGQRLLTGSNDGSAVVWNFRRPPEHQRTALPHEAPLAPGGVPETFGGTFSPDGQTLATAGSDGTARLWNSADGRPLRVLRGHRQTVNHTAFSPDGRWLATASDDREARLWDLASGLTLATLGGHDRFVRRVAFSPDSRSLLTVAGTTSALWRVPDGHLIARLGGHDAPAIDGQFSRDGRRVLTHGLDGTIRVYDAASGRSLAVLRGHEGVVTAAFFVDGDRQVVSAGVDGTMRLWDVATGIPVRRHAEPMAGPAGFRHGLLDHAGARLLLSASTGDLLLWDWRRDTRRRYAGHSIAAYALAFSRDDRLIASGSNDGSTRVWDTETGAALGDLRQPASDSPTPRWSVALAPDARRLLTTGALSPPQADLWQLSYETRDAETLADVLRCKSPWQIDGDSLVARTGQAACGAVERTNVH